MSPSLCSYWLIWKLHSNEAVDLNSRRGGGGINIVWRFAEKYRIH